MKEISAVTRHMLGDVDGNMRISWSVAPDDTSSRGLSYIDHRYTMLVMIRSFRDKDSQALFGGRCPRRWLAIRAVAERKLASLHAAATLDFLRSPPGNRLELLKGDRAGQWSLRINDQWRICFQWESGDALNVEIVDYH